MVSTAAHGGPAPHAVLHDAVAWGRVVVATAARAVLAALLGLALWAAAPALLGWHPTTVVTGSMAPRLLPGDVVVSRPVAPAEVRPGQVLLTDDPDQPGHLRMHRFAEPGRDGTIVTKGDANPRADSTPVDRSAVHGVAYLRIPFVSTPVVWIREGRWVETGTAALALLAVLALAAVDGPVRRAPGPRHRDDDDGPAARGGPTTAPRPTGGTGHRVRPAVGRHARRRGRGGTTGLAAFLVVAVAGGVGAVAPDPARAAPWPARTATVATLSAAVLPSATITACTGGTTATITWSHPGPVDPPGGFEVWVGSRLVATRPPTARTATFTTSGLEVLQSYDVTVRSLDGTWYGASAPRRVGVVVGVGALAVISCG